MDGRELDTFDQPNEKVPEEEGEADTIDNARNPLDESVIIQAGENPDYVPPSTTEENAEDIGERLANARQFDTQAKWKLYDEFFNANLNTKLVPDAGNSSRDLFRGVTTLPTSEITGVEGVYFDGVRVYYKRGRNWHKVNNKKDNI